MSHFFYLLLSWFLKPHCTLDRYHRKNVIKTTFTYSREILPEIVKTSSSITTSIDIIEKTTITKSSTMLRYFCLRPKEFNVYFLRHCQSSQTLRHWQILEPHWEEKYFNFAISNFKKKIISFPTLILARKNTLYPLPLKFLAWDIKYFFFLTCNHNLLCFPSPPPPPPPPQTLTVEWCSLPAMRRRSFYSWWGYRWSRSVSH